MRSEERRGNDGQDGMVKGGNKGNQGHSKDRIQKTNEKNKNRVAEGIKDKIRIRRSRERQTKKRKEAVTTERRCI